MYGKIREEIMSIAKGYDTYESFRLEIGWMDWMDDFTDAGDGEPISEYEIKLIDTILKDCYDDAHREKPIRTIHFIPSSINAKKSSRFWEIMYRIQHKVKNCYVGYDGCYTVKEYYLPKGIVAKIYENDDLGIPHSIEYYRI